MNTISEAIAAAVSGGVKADTGKARFDLLPPDALHAVAEVYTFGAEKYAPRNWEKGMDWGRVYAAGQRHMNAFWGGEVRDPETGYLHTAHAGFAALTLTAYQLRNVGQDTRMLMPIPASSPTQVAVQYRVGPDGQQAILSVADFDELVRLAGGAKLIESK